MSASDATNGGEFAAVSDRAAAQHRYLTFNRLNGFASGSLLEDVLILYGIQNGLSLWQVSLMAAFLYLSTPAILLGKTAIRYRGATATAGDAWFLRAVYALIMAGIPVWGGSVVPGLRAGVLLAVIFGLFAFRSAGMAALPSIVAWITTEVDRGRFIARAWTDTRLWQLAGSLLVMGLLALVAGERPGSEMHAYQAALLVGALFTFSASRQFRRIEDPPHVRLAAGQSIRASGLKIWRDSARWRLLVSQAAAFVALMLVIPFSTLAAKKAYGLSDFRVMGLALVSILGVVAVARKFSAHSDAKGPQSLMVWCATGLAMVCALWIGIGAAASIYVLIPIFLLNGIAGTGLQIAASHAFHQTVPESEKVTHGIWFQTLPFLAGGAAATLAGWWLQGLTRWLGPGPFAYRVYFAAVLVMMAPLLALSRLSKRRSRDAASTGG